MRRHRLPIVCTLFALLVACGGSSGPQVVTDVMTDPGGADTGRDVSTDDPGTDPGRLDLPGEDPGLDVPVGDTPIEDAPREDVPQPSDISEASDTDVREPVCSTSEDCEALLTNLRACEVPFCNPDTGECVAFVLVDGTPCGTADACQPAQKCKAGECVGTALDCDDRDVCTTDSCDPVAGCVHEANELECEDGNPCTTGDACVDKACVGGTNHCTCTIGDDCDAQDDGDLCNGVLICVDLACVPDPTTVVHCEPPPEAPCKAATCNPATGLCDVAAANNGLACSDGNACTIDDLCVRGTCDGGPAPDCDDLNPCTDDRCDSVKGCVHEDNGLFCDDGNACTVGDLCVKGQCRSGAEDDCDDDNPCTKDGCDKIGGCLHVPQIVPCDDGDACTIDDACDKEGKCQGGGALGCDDADPCVRLVRCDPKIGCVYEAAEGPCEDGNLCTDGDKCLDFKCVPGNEITCNDTLVCTADSCDPKSGCVFQKLTGTKCTDDNKCTRGDLCQDGACVPGDKVDCDDGESCTIDDCDPLKGCTHVARKDGFLCDDGNACTTGDACVSGVCTGTGKNCDDGNPCTTDGCDASTQECTHVANDLRCDDGNACTDGDACFKGECVGGAATVCDDGNPCTNDLCDKIDGCYHRNNTAACNDGNACTQDDACAAGTCIGGTAVVCDDSNPCTANGCVPATGCAYRAYADGTVCDDGLFCTVGETCTKATCGGGTANPCDDLNGCTNDSCSEKAGSCLHANNTVACSDGVACTLGDTCSAGVCKPGALQACEQPNPVCYTTTTPCACLTRGPVVCNAARANLCVTRDTATQTAGCYCGKNPACGSRYTCECDPRDPANCSCQLIL